MDHVKHIFVEQLTKLKENGLAQVNIGGRPFTLKQQFIDDLRHHVVLKTLADLNKSILILHSPQDETVSIDNAALLYQAARHPKSFVSLDGADHLLTHKNDSHYAGEMIATWAQRYLDLPNHVELETEHQTVALLGDKDSGYTTLIKAGKHFITADEPADVGGDDFGPTPYQLLSSALAACTTMTLRMYANRKNLEVNEIKVHVNHDKRHCEDCDK
ncbi:MAG: OsmC family protein [Cytophagales bacterium]|nr:OsmC family protein [Cytophagales bacterium]